MWENSLATVFLCSCPSCHILHKIHFSKNLAEPEKNCQSEIVCLCFFYLTNHSLPFYVNLIPLFISLFLGPLSTEQWRQSGVPWGLRRVSLNIKSPQWTPRQTPRAAFLCPHCPSAYNGRNEGRRSDSEKGDTMTDFRLSLLSRFFLLFWTSQSCFSMSAVKWCHLGPSCMGKNDSWCHFYSWVHLDSFLSIFNMLYFLFCLRMLTFGSCC